MNFVLHGHSVSAGITIGPITFAEDGSLITDVVVEQVLSAELMVTRSTPRTVVAA